MSDEKDDEPTGSEVEASTVAKVTKEEPVEPKKQRSGFITALILGPPLIAKFGIVLVVKLLTDLVVFPLLFLYRICRLAKNKVIGLFKKDDAMNGDTINGSS